MPQLKQSVAAELSAKVMAPGGATCSDRVEILLSAWEEMHREARPLRTRVEQLEEALGPFARLGSIQNAGDWINAGHVAAARTVLENAACLNCRQTLAHHQHETGFGLVCPTDAAARTDDERFTYHAARDL